MHRRRKSTRPEPSTYAPPPNTPPHPDLPYGWTARFDARYQRFYYIDLATKRTQWEVPLAAASAPLRGRASGECQRPVSFPDGIESPEPRGQDTGQRRGQGLLICAAGEGVSGGQGSGENRGGVCAGGCAHAGCASCGNYGCGRGAAGRDHVGNSVDIRATSHEPGPRAGYSGEDNSRPINSQESAEAGDASARARARETSQPREVVDRGRSRPANPGAILGSRSGLSLVTDTGAGLVHTGTGFIQKGAETVRDTTDLAVHTGAGIVPNRAGLLHNAADVVAGRDEHRHSRADCPHCGAGTGRISGGPELMCGAGAGVNQIVGAGVIALANSGDLVCGVDFPYSGTGVVTVPGGTELVYRTTGVNRVTAAETTQGRADGGCSGELARRDCPPPREGRSLVNLFRRAFRGFWMLVRIVARR